MKKHGNSYISKTHYGRQNFDIFVQNKPVSISQIVYIADLT